MLAANSNWGSNDAQRHASRRILLNPFSRGRSVFRIRLVELPMPTGSKDPDILLSWILDSMGLVRRKSESGTLDEAQGALHRLMRGTLLSEPLAGWDAKSLGEASGLSQTGVHHQLVKLRESGLVSAETDGRWHVHVLRGGSISAAVEIMSAEAKAILKLRMSEFGGFVVESDERMSIPMEEEIPEFRIVIAEPSASVDGVDRLDSLVNDLGLSGDRARSDDRIARVVLEELANGTSAITVLALSDKVGETRSRVGRAIERMRSAGIVERVPMMDRIAQDVYLGVMRQLDARGEEWLMTRGGLGRLDVGISKKLLNGAKKKTLNIESVQSILESVPLDTQKVLLNTLGGRMPYGFRIAGRDGDNVSERVMRNADRTLRRLRTVALRLDEALAD